MQKSFILISLLLILILSSSLGFAAEGTTEETIIEKPILEETVVEESATEIEQIPVLMYHHILPENMLADLPFNAAVIAFESFKEQMKWLKDEGWNALSLEEFHSALTSEEPLPEKAFVLTFDDGYASNLFFAYPTLNRYNFPAAEFVITANLEEETRKWDGKKLSWKDVKAISSLFSIQSHTHAFHNMEDDQPLLTVKTKEEIQADLDFAWAEIDRHIEPGFRAFAYPYGVASETAMEVLSSQNVKLAFTTTEGYATKDSDLLLIPRFSITPSVAMEDFQSIFGQLPPKPAEDETDTEPVPIIDLEIDSTTTKDPRE